MYSYDCIITIYYRKKLNLDHKSLCETINKINRIQKKSKFLLYN